MQYFWISGISNRNGASTIRPSKMVLEKQLTNGFLFAKLVLGNPSTSINDVWLIGLIFPKNNLRSTRDGG